jgi:hypothetical protein
LQDALFGAGGGGVHLLAGALFVWMGDYGEKVFERLEVVMLGGGLDYCFN